MPGPKPCPPALPASPWQGVLGDLSGRVSSWGQRGVLFLLCASYPASLFLLLSSSAVSEKTGLELAFWGPEGWLEQEELHV